MSRQIARENLIKLVFEFLFLNKIDQTQIENLTIDKSFSKEDKAYVEGTLTNIVKNVDELNKIVTSNVKDFSINQLVKMDLAILYVATYEIKFGDVPYQVAINEALNIAKKYSTEKSAKFINGVLSSIVNGSK